MTTLQTISTPETRREGLYEPLVKTVVSGVTAQFGHVLTPAQLVALSDVCRLELHAFVFGERYREHREACLITEKVIPVVLRDVILSCVEQINERTATVH